MTLPRPRARRAAIVALVLTTTALLASCGTDDAATDTTTTIDVSGAGTTAPSDPNVVVVDPGDSTPGTAPAPQPTPMTPRPGTRDPHAVGWESTTTSDDERTIEIRYWSGIEPCSVLDRVEVDETDTTVTLTVYEGADPDASADLACIDIAMYKSTTITLDGPLGDRTIVDGAA